jgi:hypothetical protein
MMLKYAGAAALGLALLATPGTSQTVAEQMQKAIYAQQTAGDLDTAIRIYREIITSSGADRKTAAAVQFRLAQALLQKGDLAEAAREFQMLANYPEYKDAIATLAGRVNGPADSVISLGDYTSATGQPGHYANHSSGVSVTVPVGWGIMDHDSSDGGEEVQLTDPETHYVIVVWMKPEQHPAAELAGRLRHDLENKPKAQRTDAWKVRPESVQTGGAGNAQYLKAVADLTVQNFQIVQYMMWERSPRSHVYIFADVPTTAAGKAFADKFARVAETVVVP